MFARFFIERPVLSNVIAVFILILGGVAIFTLPVTQYPAITPVTIQVTASYPGASARAMAEKVALPIEQKVNGVKGMLYMQSYSSNSGNYNLIVTFAIGTEPNAAEILVQNRVASALNQLPQAVQSQGVVVQTKSTSILQIVTIISPSGQYDSLFLNNFATLNLLNEIERIEGVGGVTVFGVGPYSMRIWLDPGQLQARSLTPLDVIEALREQNVEVAAGRLGSSPALASQAYQLTVRVDGSLNSVDQFEQIIVKSGGDEKGGLTRLVDVARVEFGSQQYGQFFVYDGREAAGLAIFQLPGSNSLIIAEKVRAKMEKLSQSFPPEITYDIPFDTTIFVSESIREVWKTIFEAGLLVLLVIMIFLQDWRATLIPATTVPVTIIGAFAGMALLGFSINTLTLFAMVLAIGIVVDDAIVVVEGATRQIDQGESPKNAAISAMKILLGPIIGITLVLMSVFLPAAFLPGITGQMYRQFALVIAVTALLSAINALTLKPTQCVQWLRPLAPGRRKNIVFRGFNRGFQKLEDAYALLIAAMVRQSLLATLVALVLGALAIWGLLRAPTGFIPTEDQGYLMMVVQLPDAASLERTEVAMGKLAQAVEAVPGVAHLIQIGGISPIENNASLANAGVIYVMLKPWSERGKEEGLLPIYNQLVTAAKTVPEANVLVTVPPPIPGLGLASGFQMQLQLTDGSFDYNKLQSTATALIGALEEDEKIRMALTPFRADVPQLSFKVNRAQARNNNVLISDLYQTLESYVGSSYVNQMTKFGYNYNVYVQADMAFRSQASSVKNYTVRNLQGNMVPLGSLAEINSSVGPAVASFYNLFPTAAIVGGANVGFSSGQAIKLLEDLAEKILPQGMSYQWTTLAYQEKLAGSASLLIFGMSLVLVYFVLCGQYESWVIPLAVILAVPLALLGTVAVLQIPGMSNNIYVQIGLVLLIALSAKNAILIVEMFREGHASGLDRREAAVAAARSRFRPIVMTSVTFILGALPLILASGAGATARKMLGLTVASGMLASTCIAVVFVPSFCVLLSRDRRGKS